MAQMRADQDRAPEIRQVMDETGFDEIEAAFVVALERGETFGDIVSEGPMTREERRRIGLDLVAGEDDPLELDDDDDLSS
jgi:hypothetical protein